MCPFSVQVVVVLLVLSTRKILARRSDDFFGLSPFLGGGGGGGKFGFGDYPGEFQAPDALPNTTSRCFGSAIELLEKEIITDPIWNVHLGIRPPPPPSADAGGGGSSSTTTGEKKKLVIPPPFKITRLVWTIEPNPNETDTNTYIYSYPPNVVKATTVVDGEGKSTGSSSITFQPTFWRHHHHHHHHDYLTFGFTGEAGVLIRLPRTTALTTISYYSIYTPGSDRIQIMDSNGFPGLSRIALNTSKQYTEISPGQGVSLKISNSGSGGSGGVSNDPNNNVDATVTAVTNGLSLFASGSGIFVQADLTQVDLVRFQDVVNSRLELRFQNVHRGFEFLGNNLYNNNKVYLQGPLSKALQPVLATEDVELQIYDPSGEYQCYNPIDDIFDCTLLVNAPVMVGMLTPFPCTTLPISVEDVLFCNTNFLLELALERKQPEGSYFNLQGGYGCTIEGMEDNFLIPPEEDHSGGAATDTIVMIQATHPLVAIMVASLACWMTSSRLLF